jgi:hypothetical protein
MPAPNFAGYMRAAVLAQNPSHLDSWDEPTLRSVYNLLPNPSISFAIWCERMSAPGFSPPDYIDANNRFLAFARELPEIFQAENH